MPWPVKGSKKSAASPTSSAPPSSATDARDHWANGPVTSTSRTRRRGSKRPRSPGNRSSSANHAVRESRPRPPPPPPHPRPPPPPPPTGTPPPPRAAHRSSVAAQVRDRDTLAQGRSRPRGGAHQDAVQRGAREGVAVRSRARVGVGGGEMAAHHGPARRDHLHPGELGVRGALHL